MKKILFSLFLVFVTLGLHAQNGYWEEAKGPYGGYFELTKTTNDTLYAIKNYTCYKSYRSTDGGESWEPLMFLNQAFPDSYIDRLQVGPTGTVYAGDVSFNDGWKWIRTTNDGQTWDTLNLNAADFCETPSGVLIASKSDALLRSTDGGQNWDTTLIDSRAFRPKYAPYGGLIAIVGNGIPNAILRSSDDGLTWDTISTPFEYKSYFFTSTGTLICTDQFDQLFRSVDGGASFQPIAFVTDFYYWLSATNTLSGRIIVNGHDGLHASPRGYYSDDDGISWQMLPPKNFAHSEYLAPISAMANGKIFTSLLSVSTDAGMSWKFSGTGARTSNISSLKVITDSLLYASNDVGYWKTENAGEIWTLLPKNNYLEYTNSNLEITSNGGVILTYDGQLYWLANGSNNLENITPSDTFPGGRVGLVFIDPSNDHFFVSTKRGLERSQDLGQTWNLMVDNLVLESMVFHPSGRIIGFGEHLAGNLIYLSDDGGVTWQSVDLQNTGVFTFLNIAPDGNLYALESQFPDGYYLWKSEDIGQTWSNLPPNLTPLSSYSIQNFAIASNGHLYITDGNRYIYSSTNEGLTWQTYPSPAGLYDQYMDQVVLSPSQHLYTWASNGNFYKTRNPVIEGTYIQGHVRIDADADCSTADAQTPIKNRIIEAQGSDFSYFTNTDTLGHYVFFVDTGAYTVSAQNPSNIWWTYCEDSVQINLPDLFITDTVDFAAIPLSFCPLITVNVGVPLLRRCFNNEVYIAYCNQGTELADSAWVDVMLDPYLSLTDSDQPYEILGNNSIRFFVGDVPSGDCGQFQLTVYLNCDSTIIGQTHCITAHGFPDTLCTTVPDWSGANIEASVTCQDTTLRFKLENTGAAHSESLEYIIIEDDVVLFTGQKEYEVAEDLILDFPANGKTWRIESEQEPGHPFSTLALAFEEGCGGFNSLGYINQFPVNGIQPSWHRMCVENIGSFDPNDKRGFPNGVGAEHNIRPGQTIDYLIRFQNTGTDTAFTVSIKDTLSVFLDPTSIRPGASSHAYTWDLSGQGVISFIFKNIMLPDSNVNEAASHGFVQFSIDPYATVPLGSVIENDAAIYFDFNAPVITNTTWHTIEKSLLSSAVQPEPKTLESSLEIWPNPFSERTNIRLKKKMSGTMMLNVYDSRGSLVAQKTALGPDIEFNGKHLPSGLYWAEVRDEKGRLLGNGKLVKE